MYTHTRTYSTYFTYLALPLVFQQTHRLTEANSVRTGSRQYYNLARH